jgi:Fe-S cluster assembly scaffold protein SufB
MDEEQLFYLLSRGIPHYEAHQLIADGFIGEAIDKFQS